MNINFHSQGFPQNLHPNLIGWNLLTFNDIDLITAAITIGRRNRWAVLRHGHYSILEIIYRVSMIYANLRRNQLGYITKSPAYIGLDPSEKGAISYFIGLTSASLMGYSVLGIPFLMHLEVYVEYIERVYGPIVFRNNLRPDLIGLDADLDWYIIEAKGRSGVLPDDVLVRAKKQTISIRSIGNQNPKLRIALASYFERNILKIRMIDPPGYNKDSYFDLNEINKLDFLRRYYLPFYVLIDRDFVHQLYDENNNYYIIYVNSLDLFLNIPKILQELFDSQDYDEDWLKTFVKRINNLDFEKHGEIVVKHSSGIIFEYGPSWSNGLNVLNQSKNE